MDTDLKTICIFTTIFGGYITVCYVVATIVHGSNGNLFTAATNVLTMFVTGVIAFAYQRNKAKKEAT